MAKTLIDLVRDLIGVDVEVTPRAPTVSVSTTITQVVPRDENRVALILINLGTNPVFLTPVGTPSTTLGIRLAPSGGGVSLIWRDDLHLPGLEWNAVTDAGTSTVYRLELHTR